MIDRYLIRYFLAVVDQGNFSRAAAQCHVSQPTLSVGIAKLETLIGSTLFTRTSRRVELTRDGVRFLGHARRIESEFLAAETPDQSRSRNLLRVGMLSTLSPTWVETMIRRSGVNWIGGGLEIVDGRAGELRAKLERGRIDAAITLIDEPGVAAKPLYREGFGLALGTLHPLAGATSLRAEDVADHVMLVRRQCEMLSATSRHFTVRGIRPFMAAKTLDEARALAMVRAGLGVTVAPESFHGDGVAIIPITGFGVERIIGVVHSDTNRMMLDAGSLALLDRLTGTLSELAKQAGLDQLTGR